MPSANDNFANATDLGSALTGAVTFDNTGNTAEAGEPIPTEGPGDGPWSSAWFKLTAPAGGFDTLEIDTLGSRVTGGVTGMDTVLALYTGASLATLSEYASNDDYGPYTGEDNFQSRLDLTDIPAGTVFWIQVSCYDNAEEGIAHLNWVGVEGTPPPALPDFTGIDLVKRRRVWQTFPGVPALVNGRPDPNVWLPTDHDVEDGYYQVIVNGSDYTTFRGILAEVGSLEYEVPFDDAAGELHFPQITSFEKLGVGELVDFIDTANNEPRSNVEIYYVDADDAQHPVYQGFIAANEWRGGSLTCVLTGAIHQEDLFKRAPGADDQEYDIAELIQNQFVHASRPSLRTKEMTIFSGTTISSRYKGGWEGVLTYIKKLLATAIDPSDNVQWTVMLEPGRRPVLRKKKNVVVASVDYTISYGAAGIDVEIQEELLNRWNVGYAEGETGGIPWRHAHRDDTLGFLYQPVVFDPEVHTYEEDSTGNIVPTGGTIVPEKMRVETHLDFGSGFTPDRAQTIAEQIYARDSAQHYVGTVTLHGVSPEECHAALIQPDKILGIRYLFGEAIMKFYITKVSVNPFETGGGTVTLSVDTAGRDYDLFEAVKERQDAIARNPMAGMLIGNESGVNLDSKVPWDWQTSGWLPKERRLDPTARFTVNSRTWAVFSVLTAERVDIFRFEMHFNEDVPFHVSIYDSDPTGGSVLLPDNPMAAPVGTPAVGPWTDPKPDGFLIGWGQYQGRVGYYPHTEYDEQGAPTLASPTGDFVEEAQFELNHDGAESRGESDPAIHFVAVYVDADGGPFHGWAYMSPGKLQG